MNELLIWEPEGRRIEILKTKKPMTTTEEICDQKLQLSHLGETVFERLSKNQQIRRSLFDWGRLHVDRQLPFLCVYRHRSKGKEREIKSLITGEAAYLLASGEAKFSKEISFLIRKIADVAKEVFGTFLIIELWSGDSVNAVTDADHAPSIPEFKIFVGKEEGLYSTVEAFDHALRKISVGGKQATVERNIGKGAHPRDLGPLLGKERVKDEAVHAIGIEISPIYRDSETGESFPLVVRSLKRQVSIAIKRGVFDYVKSRAISAPKNYQSLGRKKFVKAAWEVDSKLAEVADAFDFLLLVSPVNSDDAWNQFKRNRFKKVPEFWYPPIPVEPDLLKRKLFQVPIERVEDPLLADMFRGKQYELDQQLTLLRNRGQPGFLHGSRYLYGILDNELIKTALKLLNDTKIVNESDSTDSMVSASQIASKARNELKYYHSKYCETLGSVEIREDIAGVMVSRGTLLIGKKTQVSANRLDALLQHEVGTHIVTYINGCSQPFKQLYSGLAGYNDLQEGLAVLSEYLVGGLTSSRIRAIAARVIAVAGMVEGASLMDTFRLLHDKYQFAGRQAFSIAVRVHRGGGLTKDAIYLHGLKKLLNYLTDGGDFKILFSGKFDFQHIPLIAELQKRKILKKPPLLPRYLERKSVLEKIKSLCEYEGDVITLIRKEENT